ncbi:hypothetical protein [Collimonas pratensis]|uniref:CheA signal transduction histidine kinase n=1 Tax=Collimonas pratensis TaxID=279113 RepID=A0A127QYW8_9BURK|nr:hypothetical protein [Collimonas pratensis]AMP04785.1 hypothetical protein CPter91_2426 [Collimonas pratensis]AMP15171.1 hypothetical protein CPter291_2919 [Collimonas pratensis]NKI69593.1 hypothetical protein [Collimonas pratensis]
MKCALKATALLIALSATNLALADIISGSTSDSGSNSGSTSTSTSQGAGSSVNTIGTNSNSSSGSTSGSNASAIGGGASRSSSTGGNSTAAGGAGGNSHSNSAGGNSTVSVSVSLPSTATGSTSGAGGTTAAAGEPGSSPNNTLTTVDYGGTYTVKTVPNIVAPSLTTTLSDTCMGSASFGLSFTGFGATGGTTMVDQACVRRLDSREFRAMGLNDVALALLCQSEANRKAVESTGRSCPGMERAAAPASPAAPSAENNAVSQNLMNIGDQYKDPLIRARLGLDKMPELSALKDR